MTTPGFIDWVRVFPHYLLPQHAISRLVYGLTRCYWAPLKNTLIKLFISHFRVDMSLAQESDPTAYPTFNHFFTRALKTGVRVVNRDPETIVSPVDGSISQTGKIREGEIFQAKNRKFDLASLLADDHDMVDAFQDGLFATLYLSPRDYHRIHMPLSGCLKKMVYIPGQLFPVNTDSVKVVKRLFARNERVINYFDTGIGPMAVIMVGAINVGSMETVWAGEITPAENRSITTTNYSNKIIKLERGEEMGRFNMGSTVLLLFQKHRMEWKNELEAGDTISMGQQLGQITT